MAEPVRITDGNMATLAITPSEVADAIEAALMQKAEGRLHTAPKASLLPGGGRYVMSTLAVGDDGYTVVKTVTVSPENPSRGLPSINGAIQVFDAETGRLLAQMDANWITAVRTAGLSTVAARRLGDADSESIAFVGTGVQARSHLDAFSAIFPLKRVMGVGRGRANLEKLSSHADAMGLAFEIADTPRAALERADLIVTSVTLDYTIEPFLDARWLKPNAFAAITDLTIPWKPEGLDAFGTVIVDDLEQERSAERPMLPPAQIDGDLTHLVTGKPMPRVDGKPSAFAFRGISLGDYAVAVLVLERSRARPG